MTHKFKMGDIVKCNIETGDNDYFIKGETYEIISLSRETWGHEYGLTGISDIAYMKLEDIEDGWEMNFVEEGFTKINNTWKEILK